MEKYVEFRTLISCRGIDVDFLGIQFILVILPLSTFFLFFSFPLELQIRLRRDPQPISQAYSSERAVSRY